MSSSHIKPIFVFLLVVVCLTVPSSYSLLPPDQYVLYRESKGQTDGSWRTRVGFLSRDDKTIYWKMSGYQTEVFSLVAVTYISDDPLWYVENYRARGTITIHDTRIKFNLIIENKFYCNETYYR